MSKIDTGGPAYPTSMPHLVVPMPKNYKNPSKDLVDYIAELKSSESILRVDYSGLTWLDLCAINAMQSFLNQRITLILTNQPHLHGIEFTNELVYQIEKPFGSVAVVAYRLAQTMLAEKRRLEAIE